MTEDPLNYIINLFIYKPLISLEHQIIYLRINLEFINLEHNDIPRISLNMN